MKRIIFIGTLICFLLLTASVPVFAAPDFNTSTSMEYLPNGDYIETSIQESTLNSRIVPFSAAARTSGSKTVRYKNSAGVVQWYVKVTGCFTYNGSTSSCTSSSVEADSNVFAWQISNKSASRSNATATGRATARLYSGSTIIQTITETVNLTCSKTGALS